MRIADRLTVIETKLKYIERTMYAIIAILLAQIGIDKLPL